MANTNDFFEVRGADTLARELGELGDSILADIIGPAVDQGAEITLQAAKNNAPSDDGHLKQNIKKKLFVKGRGATALIGVLDTTATDEKGRPVALYGGVQDAEEHWLTGSLEQTKKQAVTKIIKETQKGLDRFHARRGDQGK